MDNINKSGTTTTQIDSHILNVSSGNSNYEDSTFDGISLGLGAIGSVNNISADNYSEGFTYTPFGNSIIIAVPYSVIGFAQSLNSVGAAYPVSHVNISAFISGFSNGTQGTFVDRQVFASYATGYNISTVENSTAGLNQAYLEWLSGSSLVAGALSIYTSAYPPQSLQF